MPDGRVSPGRDGRTGHGRVSPGGGTRLASPCDRSSSTALAPPGHVMSPPEWITALASAITEHLVAASIPAPMGAHVQKADGDADAWEVSLFYGKTEIVGGPKDGKQTDTPFWLDLAGLGRVFDRVDGLTWQAAPLGPDDELGPHVAIEGEYLGNRVTVRILATAPQQFPPARSADTLRGTFVDLW